MSKVKESSNGKRGGLFKGKTHDEGGIPAIVTDTNTPIEVEGDEALINKEATAIYWKELSKINQSAGNGVPIPPPTEQPTKQPTEQPTNAEPVILTDTGSPILVETQQAIINAEATRKHWKELSKINQSAGNGKAIPNPADVSTEIRQKLEQGGKLTGKDRKAIFSKWKRLVNMSASELEKYYNSPDGETSGLTESEAKKQGIDSGRESARMIIKMKRTKNAEWTDDMWRWAGKQISFISRMRGVKGDYYQKGRKKTRKLKALLIWGHNPNKYKGSDTDFHDGGITAEKFFEDEVGHIATPKDKKINRPFRVRFHLGAGENFMKWKVENTNTKNVKFFAPETTTIHMIDCRLVNSPATASKIFTGEINKTPIAWVECTDIDINEDEISVSDNDRLAYNPRKSPNWNDADGDNIDNYIFPELITDQRSVYFDAPDGKTYRVGGVSEPEEFHLGGDMSKHLAPNGKPSNLTHEQYHLVRTPEFKAWFGDWENDPKEYDLLDENDEPKVWYHTGGDWTTLNDGGKSGKGKMMFSPTMKSMAYANESKDNKTRPFFIKCDYIYNLPYENRNKPAFYKWDNKKMNPIWFVNAYGGFIVVRQSNQIKLADGSNKTFDQLNPDIRFDNGGELIKRADGSYSRRGLWDNIRDNAGSGKKPTPEMLKQEAKIKSNMKYDLGGQIQSLKNSLRYLQGEQFTQMEAYIRTLVEKLGIEEMSQDSPNQPPLPPNEFDIDKKIVTLKQKYVMEVDSLLDGTTIEEKRKNILNWIHDKSKNVKVIIAFSGGKDSVAMVLQCLYKWKIPKDQIELWHHEVDGMGENLFDWKCTPSYCKAFAKAFGLKLLFSYANGGILREMYKTNELKQPIYFQEEAEGEYNVAFPDPNAEPRTRRMFPAVSTQLETRWCSAVAKIDVMNRAITNSRRFDNANIVIMTGERRAESRPRAKYEEIEKYKSCSRKRQAITWRSIIDLTEAEIWAMYKEHKIQPHPCYELGWGRCSCQLCIFGEADTWASINEISPEKVKRIAEIEKDFNYDLYNDYEKLSANPKVYWQSGPNEGKERFSKGRRLNGIYEARVDRGKSMIDKEKLKRWGSEALGEFISPIFVEKWELPAGAFSTEQSGAN